MERLKTMPGVAGALEHLYGGLNRAPSPTDFPQGATILHGCLPLLMEEIPAEELIQRVGQQKYARWRELHRQNTLLNLWYGLELKLVLEAAAEVHLPVMVLKGADLAFTFYADPEQRHFSDIDLMVRPEHLTAFIALLERLGYHYHQEYRFEAISQQRAAFVYTKEVAAGYLVFEIHTSPHSNEMGVSFDVAGLWERSRKIVVAGVPTSGMGLEDLLLYLCWHLRSHAFDRLIWLYDIAVVLQRCADDIDWTLLYHLARRQKLVSTLYYCVRWAEQVFGIALSKNAELERFTPPALIQKLIRRYAGDDFIPVMRRSAQRQQKLLQRLMVDNLWQLCTMPLHVIFPSPTHLGRLYMEQSQLPVRLYWLFYFIHPFILLKAFLTKSPARTTSK
jgi:putative nucleotidyltransferase-like protein